MSEASSRNAADTFFAARMGIPIGTEVECWPEARPGRSYCAVTITGERRLAGTWGYYIRTISGATDFVASTHVARRPTETPGSES